jgi:hypothetical protein
METNIERAALTVDIRKPYEKPEIIHELELETRAGSSYGTPWVIDPLIETNP